MITAPTWDAKHPVVPFEGNRMQEYPIARYEYTDGGERRRIPPEWRPLDPFTATLRYTGFTRGRSACTFWWVDGDDLLTATAYPMFASGVDVLLERALLDHGRVTGRWAARKRGTNYGIEPAR